MKSQILPPAGVELATSSLGRNRSIHLSYGGVNYFFADFLPTALETFFLVTVFLTAFLGAAFLETVFLGAAFLVPAFLAALFKGFPSCLAANLAALAAFFLASARLAARTAAFWLLISFAKKVLPSVSPKILVFTRGCIALCSLRVR